MGVIADRFAEQLAELERQQEESRLRLERFLAVVKKATRDLKEIDD
jgi:uncharacterized protein YdhG (YjbR/CyaY superfamily)